MTDTADDITHECGVKLSFSGVCSRGTRGCVRDHDITPEDLTEFEEWLDRAYDQMPLVFSRRQKLKRLLAALRRRDAEIERLHRIYVNAVKGRADMRDALRSARAKLGITEWSTVEAVERVIAERDAAKAQLARAVSCLADALAIANGAPFRNSVTLEIAKLVAEIEAEHASK